jgi:hypothetical protein
MIEQHYSFRRILEKMFLDSTESFNHAAFIKTGYYKARLKKVLIRQLLNIAEEVDYFRYLDSVEVGLSDEVALPSLNADSLLCYFTSMLLDSDFYLNINKAYNGINGLKYTFKKTSRGYSTPWHFDGDQPLEFQGVKKRSVCTVLIYLKASGNKEDGGILEFAKINSLEKPQNEQEIFQAEEFHIPEAGDVILLDSCSPVIHHRATTVLSDQERIFLFMDMLK